MDIKYAVCVLETIGSGATLSNINDKETACVMAIKALDTLEKIKDIIREEERYEVSDSIDNPRPNQADYDAVHAEKFNRIWKVISDAELRKYENLEEQGFISKLPVKIGSLLYKPNPITLSEIVEIKVESIFITEDRIDINGRTTTMKHSFFCNPSDFGETVFLTKEEAEQKLKELRGAKNS